MNYTIRFNKIARIVMLAAILLAILFDQLFMAPSTGMAQWVTARPTYDVWRAATPTGEVLQQPQATIIIIFPTATRTPTPINLGNWVWDDLDADGIQDAGEPGVAGVTVQLWNSALTDLIDSTVTNASGYYGLVAPLPGDYRIRVLLSAGDSFTSKDQGGDNTRDSDINPVGTYYGFTDVFNIATNVISISSLDAGIMVYKTPTPTRTPTPINLGNFVWRDSDADGIQDAGESGVPYVTMQLWNDAKTQLIDSTVTDASGNYWLVAPLPGDYRIRVLLPVAEAEFSPKLQGGSLTADSNINPSGENFGFTDIIFIGPSVISISSIDAGLVNLPAVLPSPTAAASMTPTLPVSTVSATPTLPFTLPVPPLLRVYLPFLVR